MGMSGLLVRRKQASHDVEKPKAADNIISCVPRGLRLGYEHVRLEPERVKRFLASYGQHGLAYTHLDKNYRHFEVSQSSSAVAMDTPPGYCPSLPRSQDLHGLSFMCLCIISSKLSPVLRLAFLVTICPLWPLLVCRCPGWVW